MMKFGALNWFNSLIKKLKKALNCITHVIYTYDYHLTGVTLALKSGKYIPLTLWPNLTQY